jgi:hypothetical protein
MQDTATGQGQIGLDPNPAPPQPQPVFSGRHRRARPAACQSSVRSSIAIPSSAAKLVAFGNPGQSVRQATSPGATRSKACLAKSRNFSQHH